MICCIFDWLEQNLNGPTDYIVVYFVSFFFLFFSLFVLVVFFFYSNFVFFMKTGEALGECSDDLH